MYDEIRVDFFEIPSETGDAYLSNFCIFLKEHLLLFERRFGMGRIKLKINSKKSMISFMKQKKA